MDALKDKITRASESTNARFKRKKIRSMKREADKIAEKLAASKAKLELVEQRVPIDPIRGAPLKLHPPNDRDGWMERELLMGLTEDVGSMEGLEWMWKPSLMESVEL